MKIYDVNSSKLKKLTKIVKRFKTLFYLTMEEITLVEKIK